MIFGHDFQGAIASSKPSKSKFYWELIEIKSHTFAFAVNSCYNKLFYDRLKTANSPTPGPRPLEAPGLPLASCLLPPPAPAPVQPGEGTRKARGMSPILSPRCVGAAA